MGLNLRAKLLLSLTTVLAVLSIVGFMTLNVQSDWGFIVQHRGSRLLGMLLVAITMGLATVVFQTITHNRILTPSLMGFDVLYVLVHSLALLVWGVGQNTGWPVELRFIVEVAVMVSIALVIFRLLFTDSVRGLHVLILLGMVTGLLFRELAELAQRIFDPSEFSIQQGSGIANFNRINVQLLWVGLIGVGLCSALLFRFRHQLDVLILGRDVAINLGIPYTKTITLLMLAICVLVSISTALVGPMLFFGLLVANLAYWITGSHQHRWTLPASVLAGIVCLVGGQLVFEHLLNSGLPLAMIIELCGGVLFIVLLLRGVKQ
ncbi:iron chelate uptake ABC transporter family permease subunit [Marinobacter sp. 2_MG-2023]|uniref:iron chelate uptake ABC transporter family permease subunit n=1 Tax=Marinobacter sp. 2_MG-2023 TaxID=3062679 RepID=UPI0026E1A080|nr:iron chelate uptake ABC transporter family permease subunit [Marinobacter sp. 2_MG-2023]MDO6440742.1 iron chelate uptake ABC transporter family permease subunit [Marinobacter sp. 2_MG-2023]